jgi:hypothetical protein
MTLERLKGQIASYLQRQVSDYVVNRVDMLLEAINDSQQGAQQLYDFEYSKVVVDALVDLTTGVPISPLYLHGQIPGYDYGDIILPPPPEPPPDPISVKKVLRAYVSDGTGNPRPIKFMGRETQFQDVTQRWAGIPTPYAPSQRDRPSYPTFYETYLVQQGQTLFLYPDATGTAAQNPFLVFLDVIRYWPEYDDTQLVDSNVDWLMEFGDAFIKWDAICQLNTYNKEFVPRQEGNVPAPTELRDAAWKELLAWDAQLITTGDSFVNLD